MAVIIGSARSDERGRITGGAAGDQKQSSAAKDDYVGEVSMQNFYLHNKGWYILRAIDPQVGEKLASLMRQACNNSNLGYSQSDRYGVIKNGISSKVKTNCDCSSLVRECIFEATGKMLNDFNTANEVWILESSGIFNKRQAYKTGSTLYNGDILVTKTKGHTVIVVEGTSRVVKKQDSPNTGHLQLNYTVGNTYTVSNCTELNVRTKTSQQTVMSVVNGSIIGTKKKGDKIKCLAAGSYNGKIYVYFGVNSKGQEQWVCADNGTVAYLT